MTFDEYYRIAMGDKAENGPYPYQKRFATTQDLPLLMRVPTGAGKTGAVVLGWLWRRQFSGSEVGKATPRRLVYCLPMRVLVEQTNREVTRWLSNLGVTDIQVRVLMGGVEAEDWFLHPEQSAILIGTQDMLLSRALNRGYGASRFHWPIDFGLLNNDCLWVFDEPQLMGSGVSTSAQLAGLRTSLGTFGPTTSIWMSATLEPGWLDTVDFSMTGRGPVLELNEEDYDSKWPLRDRMTAEKALQRLDAKASKDGKSVAKQILELHRDGTQTLVVVNTVERAKAVYEAIKKAKAGPNDVLLVHSRFRPHEREQLNDKLKKPATDRIIVATQVVEAGVDISSRTLVTELAPWASLVQRIGRCNRTGKDGPGRVLWIDVDDKDAAPYEQEDLQFAREQLAKLEGRDVSPKALDNFKREQEISLPFSHTHVLRRRDLLDLFDTSPDLSGNDIDVSRYIRSESNDCDVQVFWRDFSPERPGEQPAPVRSELCSVRISAFRAFMEKERKGKKPTGYTWDYLEGVWRSIRDWKRDVHPGLTILLPTSLGGYDKILGWSQESTDPVEPIPVVLSSQPEGSGDDPGSCGPALTITEHTKHVCDELRGILEVLAGLIREWEDRLLQAARWHDAGKGHEVYQNSIRSAANGSLGGDSLWAKSGTNTPLRNKRRFFRHELASALAALQQGQPFEVAYLDAAHHGRVRISIRSLPGEEPPPDSKVAFALGVHDRDPLPEIKLAEGVICPAMTLDLLPMQLGGDASWTARALGLRDEIGPFRLAYLETLLRAADRRASAKERVGPR